MAHPHRLPRRALHTDHVRAQIRAVEDLGLTDWVLWNAPGVYPAEAFRPVAHGRGVEAPPAAMRDP